MQKNNENGRVARTRSDDKTTKNITVSLWIPEKQIQN